jgi:dTDP-4-dehydrorhamnose reductase
MKRRLLVFGGSGFIGGNLIKMARLKGWDTHIASSNASSYVNWSKVDITNKFEVDKIIETVCPDAVINLAAISNVDMAEQEKEETWKVNVEGAKYIAQSCAIHNIKYIFFSSDAVFDGESNIYFEGDIPSPINYYGKTKAEAEKNVLETNPRSIVVRISTVMGFSVEGGKSFFGQLRDNLENGTEILCPTYEFRTPVDVLTLSECVLELVDAEFSGILHIGSTDSVSRYELTKRAALLMGYDGKLVKAQFAPEEKAKIACRHRNGIIDVSKAQVLLKTRLLSVNESIAKIIAPLEK